MARQQGARVTTAFAFESTYGTAPASGYTFLPFISTGLSAEQPLLDDDILGLGRDPQAPIKDAVTVDGDHVIPLDLRGIGYWLKLLFGSPTLVPNAAAAGVITFAAQPQVNSTVTINGTVFTFVASGAVGNKVNIGGSLSATMTALAVALNASVVAGVALATYAGTASTLTILHDALGPAGNTFTLAASTSPASNGTVSGATLSGGSNVHTFPSGLWTLPSASIEVQMPQVPSFAMYSGVMADRLSISMARSGLLQATVGLIAQGETIAGATAAGTPTALAGGIKRFGHFNGSITRNGVALGNIESAEINYMNNLDRIETIRSDGKLDGLDPSKAMMNGNITARFADMVLLDQATSGSSCELEFEWDLGPNQVMKIIIYRVFLPVPRRAVDGPGGIRTTFNWQAATNTGGSPARMCSVTLNNDVAAY